MAETPDGSLWGSTYQGFYRLRWKGGGAALSQDNPDLSPALVHDVLSPQNEKGEKVFFADLAVQPDGSLWAYQLGGDVFSLKPGSTHFERFDLPSFPTTSTSVGTKGRFYFIQDGNQLSTFGDEGYREIRLSTSLVHLSFINLHPGLDGNVIVAFSKDNRVRYYSVPEAEMLAKGFSRTTFISP